MSLSEIYTDRRCLHLRNLAEYSVYSTVQARKIDRQREPATLRITRLESYQRFPIFDTNRSYTISHKIRCIGDRIPLFTLTGRKPKKKRIISMAEEKDLEEFLVWVKIPQAPFSFVEGATKDSK